MRSIDPMPAIVSIGSRLTEDFNSAVVAGSATSTSVTEVVKALMVFAMKADVGRAWARILVGHDKKT